MAEGSGNGGGGRPSSSRRRMEMKKIENRNSREVTFSKRWQGLFRKAGELSVLCGAEIAILTYSPNGNPFPFGSSSVDATLRRFVGSAAATSECSGMTMAVPREDLQLEKEALSRLREMREACRRDGGLRTWWEDPIKDMEVEALEGFMEGMERLRETVGKRLDEMEKATAAAPAPGSVDSTVGVCGKEEPVPFESLISESLFDFDFDYGAMSLLSQGTSMFDPFVRKLDIF